MIAKSRKKNILCTKTFDNTGRLNKYLKKLYDLFLFINICFAKTMKNIQ